MIPSKEAVLIQTLILLPPPLIFGRISKGINTAVWTFLSPSSEPKITCTSYAIHSYFLSAIWQSHNQF